MQTESFIQELLRLVPELAPTLNEHIEENGSLLPHVFFGDVTRFAIAEAIKDRNSQILVRLLEQMENGLQTGDAEVNELIAVSFVENLCGEDALHILRPLMGGNLRRELANTCREI